MDKAQVFIFNYARFPDALALFNTFTNLQYETFLINCASKNDPKFKPTDHIIALPNVFYSGQWNEALKLASGDVMLLINSDVQVPHPVKVMDRMMKFYRLYGKKGALYAPNVDWTPWTYNFHMLEEIKGGYRKVVATDSAIWSLRTELARKVGVIDLNVNRLGWGIEIVAAYYASKAAGYVVRDYNVKCLHPNHTAYDKGQAERQYHSMIQKMGIGQDFWKYLDRRNRFGFGSPDKSEIKLRFRKMML